MATKQYDKPIEWSQHVYGYNIATKSVFIYHRMSWKKPSRLTGTVCQRKKRRAYVSLCQST